MPGNSFKFSIGKKILLGFFILILIYFGATLFGYFQMQDLRVHSQRVIPLSSQISNLQEIGISLESLERNVDKFFTVAYSEHLEKANKDLDDLHGIIWSLENHSDNNTRVRFEEMDGIFFEIRENINYLANLQKNSTNHNEINEKRVLVYELINKGKQKHRELLSETTDQLNANVLDQESIIISLNNHLLSLGFAILAAGIVMSVIISRSISRPIEKLRTATSEIARGNLDVKTGIHSKDEIGELAFAFDKMTEELQKTTISKATLQTMLDSMPYGIILIGTDKKTLSANRAALGMMGYESEEEIVGLICNKVLCPAEDDKCPIIDTKQRVDKSEKVLITKDGMRIPVLKSVVPVKLGDREVLMEAFIDISERKRAEDRIAKLNDCLLEFVPNPVVNINSLTALCGELMGADCAFYNRLESGMLCSLGQWNAPSGYKTMDRPDGHICYDVIRRCVDDLTVIHDLDETEYARSDPNVMPYSLKTYIGKSVRFGEKCVGSLCVLYKKDFYPSDDDKRLIGIIASAIGVEEKRKQSEETLKKLSSAVEESGDCVIITNKEGSIEYVNQAFEKLTGFSGKEVIGKNPNFMKSGKHDRKFYQKLYETINSGRVFHGEIINRKKNGEIYNVETTIMPIKDTQGNITHFVCSEKDITERKKSQMMLIENQQLAYASKAKSEFLANMSHELRTPLNSIIGFSELMSMNSMLDEKNKHYLENILTSGKFLLNLINDILDLSKVEAGKIELEFNKIDIPSVIDETLTLIKEKASKHNVILKKELDPAILFIEADLQRLKQILFNLLSNAVKFSKPEGGTVTITSKKEGDMVKFSVSDTGIGIRDEDMGKLFSAFEQLDSGITKKYGGTGLGLAITKKLVELHSGTITAESRFGEGSMFTFTLPVAPKK